MWLRVPFFKEEIIVIGKWKLDNIGKFPHCRYLSADTETKLYLKDKQIDEEEAYNLYKEQGQTWCKCHIQVKAYAFMLSDGESFVLFKTIEDFLVACAMFNVKRVFWYNGKFDFAIFDYYFLTNNWKRSEESIAEKKHREHINEECYQSLDGDFGQRYQMRIWKRYLNRNYKECVTQIKFVDVCNIFGGGLKRNLEDWDIRDRQGNKIRKLEMDYDNANYEQDIQYMVNDTKGLYLLAEKIDKTLFDLCGLSLFKGDYITAGGLAKKVMLSHMFKRKSNYANIKAFKQYFPLTVEEDLHFRKLNLYQGGKCMVNPYKLNKEQLGVYKYDVNSMYPAQMYNMLYPLGKPNIYTKFIKHKIDCVYIYKITNITGVVKPNMLGIWQDTLTSSYEEVFYEREERYIWWEEIEELEKWYDLTYDVIEILEYHAKHSKGMREYIETFYNVKANSKGAIKQGAKLFLNSAYGKLAQRVDKVKCWYELQEGGYVALVKGEVETDEKGMLSVVVGSRVTALARVCLMEYIRLICRNNPKKYFIYCDTDSVHALLSYNDTDDKALGKMKCEGVYDKAIYLAPKSYLMQNEEGFEVHCKGVNTKVVENEIKGLTFSQACDIFKPDRTFRCLCGLNVIGGKALINVDKMIVNSKNITKVLKNLGSLEEDIGDI